MVREARIVVPGVAHHVTQRGNNGEGVFFVDEDCRVYLSYLGESAARFGVAVLGYCLMPNHVHLIVTPEREDSLSKALGRAHLMYAQYVHRLHGRLGHFWQSRFYSCALDAGRAHQAMAYVELNPVRAGLVRRPWDYAWSSARVHCGVGRDGSGLPGLLTWTGAMPTKDWKATLRSVGKSPDTLESLRLHTRTGRPLGSDRFLSKVETLVGRGVRAAPVGRPRGSKDRRKRKARRDRGK